jgi:hypothetical protein
MADLLGIIALLGSAALVGLLIGLVICGSLPPLLRGVCLIGVLLAWTVIMGTLLTEANPPPLVPVQIAIVLLGASPVVVVSSLASLLAQHLSVSRSATLATAATAGVVSSPLCIWALFIAACSLAGECP